MKYFLLVKQHNLTGLKYLCKHKGTLNSALKYHGSGKYWRLHLAKHGKNLSTQILLETDNLSSFKEKGLYYSNLWDIVKSDKWANLCPEDGIGAPWDGKHLSEEHKRKIGMACKGKKPMLGKSHSATTKEKIRTAMQGRQLSLEWKQKIGAANKGKHLWKNIPHPMLGRKQSKLTKQKISAARKGKYAGENHPNWKGGVSDNYQRKIK